MKRASLFCYLLQSFALLVASFSKPPKPRKSVCCLSMSTKFDLPLPGLPIPEPICSDVPGTWAHDTMSRRLNEEILQRTYEDNKAEWEEPKFQPVLKRFLELREDIGSSGQLKMLNALQPEAPEARVKEWTEWNQILQPFIDRKETWLSAPWLVTEFFVYRRLMEAIGYFDEGTPGYHYDPFAKQKQAGLESSVGSAEPMLGKIQTLPNTREGLELAASIALWGNKMDLSIWPADHANADVDIFSSILASASENLLHDDFDSLADYCNRLREKGGANIHLIVDNAGFELITDLALAQHLVQSGIASCVTFQLKSHPTFVSDALEKDLQGHIDYYRNLDPKKFPNAHKAGQIWQELLDTGKWKCNEHDFWVQAFPMWKMTEPLRTEMRETCDLAFVKGDANYRRLLGDCMWDLGAPFDKVVGNYFPTPVCALRTLKAEIGVGMDKAQVERAKQLDPSWMVNGRFGVVHFSMGAKN